MLVDLKKNKLFDQDKTHAKAHSHLKCLKILI